LGHAGNHLLIKLTNIGEFATAQKLDMPEDFIAVLNLSELTEGQDACTHGRASLSDGYLIGDEVGCQLHQGIFYVRTGAATAARCAESLKTYSVQVRDGVVHLADTAATAESSFGIPWREKI
jgi:nitrite reductase/ring-hydroxylating ferredoxin subunit